MMGNKKNMKGITLIELIITIGLITIVLSVIYNIFFVSNKTFVEGVDKSSEQQDARTVATKISNELKFAKEVRVNADLENKSNGFYKMLVVDKKLIIEKYNSDNTIDNTDTKILGNYIENIFFETKNPSKIIDFTIYTQSGKTLPNFKLDSSVRLMNTSITINNQVQNIYYTLYP